MQLINVRETEVAIKNGQSREIGNIEHTSNRTKTNKTSVRMMEEQTFFHLSRNIFK